MAIEKRGKARMVRVAPFPARTFYSMAAAEKWERHLKDRKAQGDTWTAPAATLAETMKSFIERKRQGSKPRTIELMELRMKTWAPWCNYDLTMLRRAPLEDHIYNRAMHRPRSAQAELAFLKAVLKDAQGRGQRFDQSILGIPPIKHRPADPRIITLERLDNIVTWLPSHLKILPQVAARTGMRQHELFNLTDEDLIRDENDDLKALIVRESKTEAGKRTVLLTKAAASLLREQLMVRAPSRYVFPTVSGKRWNRHNFGDEWRTARARAGEELAFRELRNVGVSLMAKSDWRIAHIGAQVGWSEKTQAAMYARYRELFEGELEERVAALDRLDEKRRAG